MKVPITLIVMDGFGLREERSGNALLGAQTPNLDRIFTSNPGCRLSASGVDVGLAAGAPGNSESGYTNIGCGRVVAQSALRITHAIEDGSFFQNDAYLGAMEHCKRNDAALHFIGLLSDGGVHSQMEHLLALLRMAKQNNLRRVYIHAFLDGRDSAPTAGKSFVEQLEKQMAALGVGQLATLIGRHYAMPRDRNGERLQCAYELLAMGAGQDVSDPAAALQASYEVGITDEFVQPMVCHRDGIFQPNDAVVCFNFRPDRSSELVRSFAAQEYKLFERQGGHMPLHLVTTTPFCPELSQISVAFPYAPMGNCFGAYLSRLGYTQLRIAEAESFDAVTLFFNGGRTVPFAGEDWVRIDAGNAENEAGGVQMNTLAVAQAAVEKMESGQYDLVVVSLPNCDIFGHMGNYELAVQAAQTVDTCVGLLVEASGRMGGVTLLTSDHGNAECMQHPDGSPMTRHTDSPVPLYLIGAGVTLKDGRLCDIVPTMLDLMGLEKPMEMNGETLIL